MGYRATITISNKKVEDMAKAISLSSASITGAMAATAEPPQIPVPAEIRLPSFQFRPKNLRMRLPPPKHMAKVNIITKKVIFPTDRITLTDSDAPRRMMASFRIFLEVNFSAGFIHAGWKKLLMIVPINKAMMDAPSKSPGTIFSTRTDSPATAKQIATPSTNIPRWFILEFIRCLLCLLSNKHLL